MAKQKPAKGKKPAKSKSDRTNTAKGSKSVPKRSAQASKSVPKAGVPATKKRSGVAASKPAAGKKAQPSTAKAADKKTGSSAGKAAAVLKSTAKQAVAKIAKLEGKAVAKVTKLESKAAEAVKAKVKPTSKQQAAVGTPPAPARVVAAAPKAKVKAPPAKAPVARSSGNGQVAGVLQAARSVASRTTKVVEVEKERKSHLTAEELAEFRQVLLDKRRELVEDMVNLEDEARRTGNEGSSGSSVMPIHMADVGSDTWEQEFTLNLIEKERLIVREIDEALERIQNRTFGTCLATGKAISKARLRVKPWAKYCIEYARKRELGLV